ncbi:hypothetical protein J6590_083292 [Homalodisca vitripennis]|nr:hypothetical protein J6590_083292 [Homalodisca vitripennis]
MASIRRNPVNTNSSVYLVGGWDLPTETYRCGLSRKNWDFVLWKPEAVSRGDHKRSFLSLSNGYETFRTIRQTYSPLIRIQRLGNIIFPHVDFFADSVTVVKKKTVNVLVL